MPIGFGQVVIDSLHADEIAAFWSALLERPVIDGANQFFAMIPASDDGSFPALMFLAVPEPREGKNRLHLDLVAADLPAEVERAVALGATKVADFDEYGSDMDHPDRSRRQHLRHRDAALLGKPASQLTCTRIRRAETSRPGQGMP